MSLVRTVFLVVLLYLWSPLRGAITDMTCTYMSSCTLPCPFDPGSEVVIHWLCPPDGANPVHTYYHDQDQLGHQNLHYKGRTTLFKDQISKGNASLMLSEIKVTDSGIYKCYTSTIRGNNEKFINMNVQAPVVDVMLQQEGDELKCISKDVHPKPVVTWSPSMQHHTTVNDQENSLYNIISSVKLSEHTADEYSCNVSTQYSWRSATYKKSEPMTTSDFKTTIPCADIETSIKSLLWTFNDTQTILNRTGSEVVSESWRQFVDHVSASGSLVLKSLTSDQQGLYSCVLKTDTKTYMTSTEMNVYGEAAKESDLTVLVVAGVLPFVVFLVVIGVAVWCIRKNKQNQPQSQQQQQQSQQQQQQQNPEEQPLQEKTDRDNNGQLPLNGKDPIEGVQSPVSKQQ